MSHPLPETLRGWGLSWGGWLDNRRGEWWLLAQLLLIALLLLLPAFPPPAALGLVWPLALRLLGAGAVAVGLAQALRAFLNLGPSLTPCRTPCPGRPW